MNESMNTDMGVEEVDDIRHCDVCIYCYKEHNNIIKRKGTPCETCDPDTHNNYIQITGKV